MYWIVSQIQTWVRSEDNKFAPPAEFNFTHWDEGDTEADDHEDSGMQFNRQAV